MVAVDWGQVKEHLDHLGREPEESPVFFFLWRKGTSELSGFGHHIAKNGRPIAKEVEYYLNSKANLSLGFVVNPGGTKKVEIKHGIALFTEDDSGASIDDQMVSWQKALLPEPSLSVFSGSKSVHHYWVFSDPVPCDLFESLQERLAAVMQAAYPSGGIDKSLSDACQVMRVAGAPHPKTGEIATIKRATGERFQLAELEKTLAHAQQHFGVVQSKLTPQPQKPKTPQLSLVPASNTPAGTIHLSDLLPKDQSETFASGVSEGGRNETAFKLAANLLGIEQHCSMEGISRLGFQVQGSAAQCLEDFNRRCSPPLPDAELQNILSSASQSNPEPDPGLDKRIAFQRNTLNKRPTAKTTSAPGTNGTSDTQGFILLANDTLQRLKDGIAAINDLSTPVARTVAQSCLRGELGLGKDAYKQAVQDLLEEQETPAPTSFDELMKLDTGVHSSIEDLAAQGTLTLVAAEGHAGKTSLFYRMAEAISTGENFAGKFKTTQGAALIYQLDESPTDAITKFRRMSLEPDASRFIPKWKLSPSMIPELEQDIRDHKPVAVFADSLMRIFGGRGISLNDAEFGIWLYQLNSIASRYGTSFFLSHHLKKPDSQKRTRVSKHDLFGTAFLFNGTSDCWGLYPSEQEGARSDEFSLEFLKARSGVQEVGTVFNFQGCQEDFSWEFMGVQGQTESLQEKKLFADEVRDLLALKGGEWTAQDVADYFTFQGRPISNERARTTLVKLYERRFMVGRGKRSSNGGRPSWKYFATAPRT